MAALITYSAASTELRSAGFLTFRRPQGVLLARCEGVETEIKANAQGYFDHADVEAAIEARNARIKPAGQGQDGAETGAGRAGQDRAVSGGLYVALGALAGLCRVAGLTLHGGACEAARNDLRPFIDAPSD